MSCRDISLLLHGLLDGELDLVTSLRVERHLDECPRCRALHARTGALRVAVRGNAEFVTAPDSLRKMLRARYGPVQQPVGGVNRHNWMPAFPGLAALVLVAWMAWVGPYQERRPTAASEAEKVVYHINSSSDVTTALRNLANHLTASPHVKVVVVAHNQGVDFLLRGARDESGKPYAVTVEELRRRGVEFRICNNTLSRLHVDTGRVIPEAVLVPSGIAEISRLQTEEGYAYMKL